MSDEIRKTNKTNKRLSDFVFDLNFASSTTTNVKHQMSKSPPGRPAVRPAAGTAVKMEDVKKERVTLSTDGQVESPAEQAFIQRKQRYSIGTVAQLCQGRRMEIIACDSLFFVCVWRDASLKLGSSVYSCASIPGFPRFFSERGRTSKSLKWSKNFAAPSTAIRRESHDASQTPTHSLLDSHASHYLFFV